MVLKLASPQDPEVVNRRVLAVDDDPILCELMREQLATLGWRVTTADNGEAAMTALAQDVPDLAIIDISMPMLDGFGLLRHMRQNPRTVDLPVIVCTSHNDRQAIDQAYRLGATSFVTKPINWPQFLHTAKFVARSGETERALRQAEADAVASGRTMSAMFQVLSHELKTPLSAMIGLTAVMDRTLRTKFPDDVGPEMHHVIEAAQRLNAIVSDIMLLSKAVTGSHHDQADVTSLSEIIEDGLAGLKAKAAERKVTVVQRPIANDACFRCEPRLLRQALFKLADNAIRFSSEGGKVEIWGDIRGNGSIVISVKDDGPGLSAQKLKDCLQPFLQELTGYARPVQGLGLGLPIAKAIAEAHGGELTIQTAPGKGLLAAIVLPATLLVPNAAKHYA